LARHSPDSVNAAQRYTGQVESSIQMKLTILGSGTVSWQTNRACSCYHIAAGDRQLILDCGSGALRRFEEANLDYMALDAALLSHTRHPDHVTDFGMLLFSFNYTFSGPQLRVREKPFQVLGPQGTKEFYQKLSAIHPDIIPQHYSVQVQDCADQTLSLGEVSITIRKVNHGDTPAVGYRLEHEGAALAFSGDSAPCDALVELFREADLVLAECSAEADVVELTNHLDARDIGKLAKAAEAKRLLITHQYPGNRREVVVNQIIENFSGPLVFADDLDTYEI